MNRRGFVKSGALLGTALAAQAQNKKASSPSGGFWHDGARFVVSLSLQMEAGAQAERAANGPWGILDAKYRDLPTEKWYEYGYKEGIPRLLEMYSRKRVKITSHMVGGAVQKNPKLAKEIVDRGHEPAAHGQTWEPIFAFTPEQERASLDANIRAIQSATGQRPFGFNAAGMRGTPNTHGILQELGFLYHTDDLSRDEPFLIPVNSKPFVVVPYTFHLNDLQQYENRWHTTADMAGELKGAFDELYAESTRKRRMISVSSHDRVAGRPGRSAVIEEFITYAQKHPGVVFLRKDEIAKYALASPLTIREGELA